MTQSTLNALLSINSNNLQRVADADKNKTYVSQTQPDEEGNYTQTWLVGKEHVTVIMNLYGTLGEQEERNDAANESIASVTA